MVPLLEQWDIMLSGAYVLDVGCGEGGGLCAMHDAGGDCTGFDIDGPRVEAARQLKGERNIPLTTGNLYDATLPFSDQRFDIVILHDVFEHLERKDDVLQKLLGYMKPDGRLLITFPPYYSAYGAHQQLLRAPFLKIPFFHLIPFALSLILPRVKGEVPYFVEEVRKLGRLKMGMRKFEGIVARRGIYHRPEPYTFRVEAASSRTHCQRPGHWRDCMYWCCVFTLENFASSKVIHGKVILPAGVCSAYNHRHDDSFVRNSTGTTTRESRHRAC
jgi:SAM-dependent methyltransferase